MPKRVDHDERRRQIADALLRTAATRGLHATGMREVAAEAGVSLRLVQYYFGTKEELLLFSMQHLAVQFAERAMARIEKIRAAETAVSPRGIIAAILTQSLPVDDERRTFSVLNAAYFALSLTDPALAIAPLARNSNAVIDVIAAQLRAAQASGDTPAGLDPDLEALSLLALASGLGTSVLAGLSSPEQAQAAIDYHLDRLLPASRPALCPRAPALTTRLTQSAASGSRRNHAGTRWVHHGCRRIRSQAGVRMSRIGRRVRAAVNPVSTAATGWWCHSALRHMLTGYGPTASQRRLIRRRMNQSAGRTPSAGQMKARAAAIDRLLGRDDHGM
jgi:AcrR family transcriptional regulator